MTEDTARELPGLASVPPADMLDLLESGWGVIANAGWDDLARTPGWQEAAEAWRDRYHALLQRATAAPEDALPAGQFGRIEIPGYREHTGFITEETRFGVQMAVVRGFDGLVVAEIAIGPGTRLVHLPTPLKRPDPADLLALTAGGDPDRDDDFDDEEPRF